MQGTGRRDLHPPAWSVTPCLPHAGHGSPAALPSFTARRASCLPIAPLALHREMLDTPGPFLLDIIVPHIQHVLPMIPGGGSFKESITEGDGSIEY